jgi:hypothetical protein
LNLNNGATNRPIHNGYFRAGRLQGFRPLCGDRGLLLPPPLSRYSMTGKRRYC